MSETSEITPLAREPTEKQTGLLASGGVLGALAASSCCLMPLALVGVGVTGAWMGALTALMPYQPIFIAMTVGFLAAGFWMVYRKPKAALVEGGTCARPVSERAVKGALWGASALVAVAVAYNFAAPFLLEA